jgi:NTP pyrophosphatase (non-canonical NTP hydrolase)
MTLPSFQETVARFVSEHQLEAPVEVRMLDLVSEIGEVAKELLKASAYGRRPFQPTDEWAGELADAFFSLICVANSTNVNLEGSLIQALEKYRGRLARKGEVSSGR